MYRVYLLQILISISLILFSCNEKEKFQISQGEIFHTYYSIKYDYKTTLDKEIKNKLLNFDNSLNPFNPNSIISKVNKNEPVILDSLFIKVFIKSMEVSQETGGMFDITSSPLINAWGFGFDKPTEISDNLIDSLKQFIGYQNIKISNGQIIKSDSRIQINTSAIAKGFSTDIIAEFLDSLNIKNYMCEIGGEIIAKGINEKGECWRIGIDKPIDNKGIEDRQLQSIIRLCDKAIATSGNYRNYYEKDGKKYAHTINPKTGYPSTGNILSATVIANDCMTADAYATAFMLLSQEEIKKISEKINLEYYIIYTDPYDFFKIAYSPGFEEYIIKK